MLYKALHYLDLFKTPLTLLFNRRRFISTKLGLFCTATILTTIIVMVSKSDIFAKAIPTILSSNLPSSHRPLIEFDQRIIAVGVQDDTYFQGFVDPGVFSIKVTNYFYNSSSNGIGYVMQAIDKPMHVCEEDDFNDPTVLYDLGLQNNYCFDKNNSNFQMEGFFDESEVKFVMIELYLCQNSTINGTCKSFEEMQHSLNGKTFNIYFKDAIINSKDHAQPIQNTIVNKYSYIDINFRKNMDLYFQKVSLNSDEGFLFTNYVNYLDYAFTTEDTDFFTVSESNLSVSRFAFNIYSDKKQQNIQRSYMKISDLLARLGGVMQSLMILSYAFIYFEQSLFLKNTILNALYIFQTFDQGKGSKTQSKNKNRGFISNFLKRVSGISLIFPKKQRLKALPEAQESNKIKANFNKKNIKDNFLVDPQIKIITNNKKRKKILDVQKFKESASPEKMLKFGIISYVVLKLKSIFTCFKLHYNEELFKKSEKIYEKELDYIEIIKKIQEIDKLKKILLDPKQQILFNFLSKPLIHLNHSKFRNLSSFNSIDLNRRSTIAGEDLRSTLEYYESLKNKNELGQTDKRLLEILNDDVKNYNL